MSIDGAKIGAVLLPLNTSYKSAEIDFALRQSETENIFLINGFRDTDYVQTIYELISLAVQTPNAACEARQRELGCHDVVNMQYTSGTTGFPQGRASCANRP